MLERIRQLEKRVEQTLERVGENSSSALTPIRFATAQLFIATSAGAALERASHPVDPLDSAGADSVPRPLSWAPLLIGPLAAAAQLEHARHPRNETLAAVRILNGASLVIGGALTLNNLFRPDATTGSSRLAPLAFAAAGLLGFAVDWQEQQARLAEEQLRRRADIVERLVPRRRAKLDRIVVHV